MEGEIDEQVVIDYAAFHISQSQNSYEASVFSMGLSEKVESGPLDQLKLHLQDACNQSDNNFKLQIIERCTDFSWFTKFTLARFLHLVNMPEVFKTIKSIVNEMAQLEETKKFHLTMYSKGHPDHSHGVTAGCMQEVGLMQKIKLETSSSDNTKNELLRAMELRLTVLKEELTASFSQAAAATCSTKEISDIASFAQYFGATDLRNCLSKYLSLISIDHHSFSSVERSTFSHDSKLDTSKSETKGISPAKIAQAERQSPTESEGSSESSDEGQSFEERSRPLIRSGSQRRSSSPMRRVQIGRSGSRRSTALTIKSLSFFPARDRTTSNRDADGADGEDEESVQSPGKPGNTVKRMSVQDAIHLFEGRQKDQTTDSQKKKDIGEISVSATANKSVLRRWSAGVVDSFSHCSHENSVDAKILTPTRGESESLSSGSKQVEDASLSVPSEMVDPEESIASKVEESGDRAAASAEWSQQKEAELNQMLAKMIESKKPGKHRGATQDISSEQRGGFYSLYNEKREEKLRAENLGTRAAKEAQFKAMQETLERSKVEMTSKKGGLTAKQHDRSNLSQKPRRNSSPPVLAKKEVPKPPGSRKPSPLPATRSSSGPILKISGTPPAKPSPGTVSSNSTQPSPGTVSSNSTLNRRKSQPTPSPTKQSPKPERSLQQKLKAPKGTRIEAKPSLKGQDEKLLKATKKAIPSPRAKNLSTSIDDLGPLGVKSTKPSFYNKVTKKGSVVPLESKPFLRKGTGIGPGVAKTKATQSDESSKNSGNLIQVEDIEATTMIFEPATLVPDHNPIQTKTGGVVNLEVVNVLIHDAPGDSDQCLATMESDLKNSEIQPDEDMGISSAAWVEIDHPESSASCENGLPEITISPEIEISPVPSSSPCVRHSLSQMLQADNFESDVVEWGNAENPPSLVYQKDAPKGFKRLLKFALKNKGDMNNACSSSAYAFSEGEDDADELKNVSKRSSDGLLRKVAIQADGGQQRAIFRESFDGDSNGVVNGQSSKKNVISLGSDKMREGGRISTTSTKATRSFFSLSTFRSGKSSETKHR